jgi:hypothetical protein
MSQQQPGGQQMPSEEELRAAYERLQVADVVVQTVVSLINIGGMKAQQGDWAQVGQAVDAAKALLPTIEAELGPDLQAVKEAIAQLQMAFAQQAKAAPASGEGQGAPGEEAPAAEGPGPAQSSGRLWVPGQ